MVNIRRLDGDLEEDPRDDQIRKMQAQLEGLTILVQRVLSSDDRSASISQAEAEAKAPPLEPVESERNRILAAWAAEDQVMISIAPTPDDVRIRDDARARMKNPELDYLPRIFQVNGVQTAVPVGSLTRVPLSIARMYEYMLNPWAARGVSAPVTFEQAEARVGLA